MLLGIHVSKLSPLEKVKVKSKKSRELHTAIGEDCEKFGINSVQIFTHGPKFFAKNALDYEKIISATKNIDLVVHAAYETTSVWRINNKNKNTPASRKKISQIEDQLKSCQMLNAWGLVIHITKIHPSEIAEAMHILKPYVEKSGVILLLEMTASKLDPDLTYETPEKLNNLITLIGHKENWYGICVDTAHIWAAGIDIRSYNSMKEWLNRLAFKSKILLFHLNGISSERGSGKDKHEIVFEKDDKIWHKIKPEYSGVRAIVEFATKRNIPIICEINRGEISDAISSLEKIKSLA